MIFDADLYHDKNQRLPKIIPFLTLIIYLEHVCIRNPNFLSIIVFKK